jgi:hypothetical protein
MNSTEVHPRLFSPAVRAELFVSAIYAVITWILVAVKISTKWKALLSLGFLTAQGTVAFTALLTGLAVVFWYFSESQTSAGIIRLHPELGEQLEKAFHKRTAVLVATLSLMNTLPDLLR